MIFGWARRRRRQQLLATKMPAAWVGYLRQYVCQYRGMTDDERGRLHDRLRILIAEKHWEGCGGLDLTDEIKVVIAGNAALELMGVEDYYFDRLMTILVYPTAYEHPPEYQQTDGLMWEGVQIEGESWAGGPIVLSWSSILDDARHPNSTRNVVVHEFAHFIDHLDGETDGVPPWTDARLHDKWLDVVDQVYDDLWQAWQQRRPMLLDPYALTNKAEFFAVSSECFFQQPAALGRQHAELFELLRQFYRIDPTPWRAPR